jgi:hypothetical protein
MNKLARNLSFDAACKERRTAIARDTLGQRAQELTYKPEAMCAVQGHILAGPVLYGNLSAWGHDAMDSDGFSSWDSHAARQFTRGFSLKSKSPRLKALRAKIPRPRPGPADLTSMVL